jgi:predicted nucleic acid-binding protein
MPGNFFDTNVVLYLASNDEIKAGQAEHVIGEGGTISVQVLNEITNVARRKMHMSWEDTHAFLGLVRDLLSVKPLSIDTHEAGILLAERYSLSVYDAMIVASALHASCETLWSEDMQSGLLIEGQLRIVNPFQK